INPHQFDVRPGVLTSALVEQGERRGSAKSPGASPDWAKAVRRGRETGHPQDEPIEDMLALDDVKFPGLSVSVVKEIFANHGTLSRFGPPPGRLKKVQATALSLNPDVAYPFGINQAGFAS